MVSSDFPMVSRNRTWDRWSVGKWKLGCGMSPTRALGTTARLAAHKAGRRVSSFLAIALELCSAVYRLFQQSYALRMTTWAPVGI